MTSRIGKVAGVALLLFAALFVNLNLIALVRAEELAENPANQRLLIREYDIDRGPIVVGGEAIADSEETDGELTYRRRYPQGPLFAHLTGYHSFVYGRARLERALNEELIGQSTEALAQNLGELFRGGERAGNSVELTIEPDVQRAARDALADRRGAVIALDPASGGVLASYSNPSYDPEPLASHDVETARRAWEDLRDDPRRPLLDRATQEIFPPGSAFKLVTAAAALEDGLQPDTSFPDEGTYDVPQTESDIGNFGDGTCTGGGSISLADALRVSCNTTFARLGVELGDEALIDQAERVGFNRTPPYELEVAESQIPESLSEPESAQSAIGQFNVAATPLQMAMIAATVANGGELLRPNVVASVRDPSGRELRGPQFGVWSDGPFNGEPISPRTAEQLREMMLSVVDDGTGSNAAIEGVEVGGKTGTAQDDDDLTVWFVGFAEDDVAVAVAIPDAGADATGGAVAAPIAREVMQAALEASP